MRVTNRHAVPRFRSGERWEGADFREQQQGERRGGYLSERRDEYDRGNEWRQQRMEPDEEQYVSRVRADRYGRSRFEDFEDEDLYFSHGQDFEEEEFEDAMYARGSDMDEEDFDDYTESDRNHRIRMESERGGLRGSRGQYSPRGYGRSSREY